MDSSNQRGQVLDLAGVLAREGNADEVLAAALPLLLDVSGAAAVLVFSRSAAGLQLTTQAGLELAAEAVQVGWLDPALATPQLSDVAVPASWQTQGIARVASHALPGERDVLTLAWTRSVDEPAEIALAISALDARVARGRTEESLADLASRVDSAQQLLSGFNQGTLANKALKAGADHYVVKGGSMRELLDLAESLFAPAS